MLPSPTFRFALSVTLIIAVILAVIHVSRPTPHQPTPIPTVAGETVAVTTEPAEIFRRAFWRQPARTDQILRAERREWIDAASAPAVSRWQWFIALHPSPELLRDLRNPETFGLAPVAADTPARPWINATSAPLPAWFPASTDGSFEILQSPSAGLSLLYRARDNTLYATDQGGGFAPATPPIAPRTAALPPTR